MPRRGRGSAFRGGRQTTQKKLAERIDKLFLPSPPPPRPTSHLLHSLLPGTSRLTKELSSSRAPQPRYGLTGGNTCTGGREERGCCRVSGSLPAAAPPREGRGRSPAPRPSSSSSSTSSSSAPPGPGQRCRWAPAASHAWAPSATRLSGAAA